jgi:hypothetical protein
MTNNELEVLVERLTYYAFGKLRRLKAVYGVRYAKGQQGPKGFDPGDFVNAAIEAYLSGGRPWNRKANPTIEAHLKDAIDSQVSNIINSVEHRRSRAVSTIGDGTDLAATAQDHWSVDPGEWVADQEWSEAFRAAAYGALKEDQIALDVLTALQEGWSRQEIIELLGMAPDQFDAARKRINRRIEQKCKRFYKEMVQ